MTKTGGKTMENLRQKAMKEIAEAILQQNPTQAESFLTDVLMRVPDMDLFAMYYERFGHAVGEVA
jgi:hypothetical protein